jgi:hypothetical protein
MSNQLQIFWLLHILIRGIPESCKAWESPYAKKYSKRRRR